VGCQFVLVYFTKILLKTYH
jgi:hypothetical protein